MSSGFVPFQSNQTFEEEVLRVLTKIKYWPRGKYALIVCAYLLLWLNARGKASRSLFVEAQKEQKKTVRDFWSTHTRKTKRKTVLLRKWRICIDLFLFLEVRALFVKGEESIKCEHIKSGQSYELDSLVEAGTFSSVKRVDYITAFGKKWANCLCGNLVKLPPSSDPY